jgi:hypothetical protein
VGQLSLQEVDVLIEKELEIEVKCTNVGEVVVKTAQWKMSLQDS